MVDVVVNPRRPIGRLDPLAFGSFVENLHRCLYGGIYDPSSPVADGNGFRTDVVEAARAMGVTNVRFPGGCFAPYYHWKDGIGPVEQRPLTRYLANGQYPASNAVGTDEFMTWCNAVGAEPYFCVNMGTGTPEEARDWVEYCNGLPGSRWADQRVRSGHPAPYGVKTVGSGQRDQRALGARLHRDRRRLRPEGPRLRRRDEGGRSHHPAGGVGRAFPDRLPPAGLEPRGPPRPAASSPSSSRPTRSPTRCWSAPTSTSSSATPTC